MVRRNVEIEARLIDGLLDLTRISRGKIELHLVSADALQLLRDALHACCQEDVDSGRVTVDLPTAGRRGGAENLRPSQGVLEPLPHPPKVPPPRQTGKPRG